MKKLTSLLIGLFSLILLNASCVPAPEATPAPTPTLEATPIVLSGHTIGVSLLAWNPQGTLLASAARGPDERIIQIWNTSGGLVRTLAGHTGPVLALAWSPDGSLLASGSADGTVRLWNSDGSPKKTLNVSYGNVWTVVWSPDGTRIATASLAPSFLPTIQMWDLNGKWLWRTMTLYNKHNFYNLAWSPDGAYLLGGNIDYALWKADGTQMAYYPSCEECAPARGAAWSPDSTLFAIGDENGELSIYNRDGEMEADRQSNFKVDSIAWSPDGRLLAAGRDVWKATGSRLTSVSGSVDSLAWSADGKYLAASAGYLITIVRPTDGTHLMVLRGHTDVINRLAWNPVAPILASASDDRTIRLWRLP